MANSQSSSEEEIACDAYIGMKAQLTSSMEKIHILIQGGISFIGSTTSLRLKHWRGKYR